MRPERIVEFGTSFGVSAIYPAVGLRDNGNGILVGSELIEKKAATALKNLAAAGLDDLADIRTGDARQTLKDPGGPIDKIHRVAGLLHSVLLEDVPAGCHLSQLAS